MLDIFEYADRLEADLVDQVSGLTHEMILDVLMDITDKNPKINKETFESFYGDVRDLLAANVGKLEQGPAVYRAAIMERLEETGIFEKKEALVPEVDPKVLEKIASLGFPDPGLAYLILNSGTFEEIKTWTRKLDRKGDPAQNLTPVFRALVTAQPELKERLRSVIEETKAFKILSDVPNLFEEYCFNPESVQTYMLFAMDYDDRVSRADQAELLKTYIEEMLKMLKEYLLS